MTVDDRAARSADGAVELPPAVRAFEKTAPVFDERFGAWLSVAAQRAAVRTQLTKIFPAGSRLLELAAGTGDDAVFMLRRGYQVTVTDGSPGMVALAAAKVHASGLADRASFGQLVLEDAAGFAASHLGAGRAPFDGIYTNFGALNCIRDVGTLAHPLGRLVRTGGRCALVVFGPLSIGEIVVELIRGRPKAAVRRLRRGPAPARLGGEHFEVWYPAPRAIGRSLSPYFRLRSVRGIGLLVPPSAAEPWISRFPGLVSAMAAADELLTGPFALLADHVLVHLERTAVQIPAE